MKAADIARRRAARRRMESLQRYRDFTLLPVALTVAVFIATLAVVLVEVFLRWARP